MWLVSDRNDLEFADGMVVKFLHIVRSKVPNRYARVVHCD
jgi:hypothetical protein